MNDHSSITVIIAKSLNAYCSLWYEYASEFETAFHFHEFHCMLINFITFVLYDVREHLYALHYAFICQPITILWQFEVSIVHYLYVP